MELPSTRKRSEGLIVGKVWDCFDNYDIGFHPLIPDFAAGGLLLPPKGIKDAEIVAGTAQVYIVLNGQPKAIDLTFGDPKDPKSGLDVADAEHFLLSPFDVCIVPPSNGIRIENHSSTIDTVLAWFFVKIMSKDDAEQSLRRTLSSLGTNPE